MAHFKDHELRSVTVKLHAQPAALSSLDHGTTFVDHMLCAAIAALAARTGEDAIPSQTSYAMARRCRQQIINEMAASSWEANIGILYVKSHPKVSPISETARLTRDQYRLDDDLEYCDPTKPSTTACPLLPGQCVNVLEVPYQEPSINDHAEDLQYASCAVFTMDPDDKYRTKPTLDDSVARLKQSSASDVSRSPSIRSKATTQPLGRLFGVSKLDEDLRTHNLKLMENASWSVPSTSPQTARMLPCPSRALIRPESRPKSFSGFQLEDRHLDNTLSQVESIQPDDLTSTCPVGGGPPELQQPSYYTPQENAGQPKSTVYSSLKQSEAPRDTKNGGVMPFDVTSDVSLSKRRVQPPLQIRLKELALDDAGDFSHERLNESSWLNLDDHSRRPSFDREAPVYNEPSVMDDFIPSRNRDNVEAAPIRPKHVSMASSNRTSGVFSLSSSMSFLTEPSSPMLSSSQPLTPTVDDCFGSPFRRTALSRPPSTAATGDDKTFRALPASRLFPGYSLPLEEHSSAQTIRPQGADNKSTTMSWDAGPDKTQQVTESRTALQELVEDMGYLGSIIG